MKMLKQLAWAPKSLLLRSARNYGITPQFLHPLDAQVLLDEFPKSTKRTKTIATIGPKSQKPEVAGQLIDEGINIARLNFSHGDHAEHLGQMVGVKEALKSRPFQHVSMLLDTKGPEIRTGNMVNNTPVVVTTGQHLELTTDYSHLGTSQRIACSYQQLARSAQIGKKILFADGAVSSIVRKVQNGIVTVQILNDGKLGNKKNMCMPGAHIELPTIGKLDEIDIVDFGLKYKCDYIAVSFARNKAELDKLRRHLIEKDPVHGPHVHLISKIENHQAVIHIDQIIEGSDGIMVARGDLGMQLPIEKVVLAQKYIMGKTIDHGKYVVCATQMVDSMEQKPRPTRAEVSDITNAVLDLTDATMTSGQTTNGMFPVQSIRTLRQISQETELVTAYKRIFEYKKKHLNNSDREAVGAVSLSFELAADLIFLETNNIKLINRISSLRPRAYLCIFTDDINVKNLTTCNFGVYTFPRSFAKNPEEFIGTIGKGFVTSNRPEVTILHLETDASGRITDHRVKRTNKS